MRTPIFIYYIFLLLTGIISSCTNNEAIVNDIQKVTDNISQYMTVNNEFQWELNIPKDEASNLGITQEEYNQALSDIKRINEQIEIAKTDTNATTIFCLSDKQIEINNGEIKITKKSKTKSAQYCTAQHNDIKWYQHFLAASKKRISSIGGVSFFTAQPQHTICVQIDAYVDQGYFLHMWSCEVINDVTKERWIASGNGTWTNFAKEMHASTSVDGQDHHWNISCSVPYPCACFVDISCYTNTPYKGNE